MKKTIYTFLFILSSWLTANAQQGTWATKESLSGGVNDVRWGAVGFSIDDKGYVGTGTTTGSDFLNDFWEYDPASDTWTQKASLPDGRMEAAGFSINGKGYIGTGKGTDGFLQDFYEYDPTGNSWTAKQDFGGSARSAAVGFSIDGKGYIGTGRDVNRMSDFWEYDPGTDTWTQKAAFGGGLRSNAAGFSIGSKGYIGTGFDGSILRNDFWEYDPASDTWTQKADFTGGARDGATGFSIGDKGYIGTGAIGANMQNDLWEYDVASDAWSQKADFTGAGRQGAVSFSIGNSGYIGTGNDGGTTNYNDLYEFTPDTKIIYVKAGGAGDGSGDDWDNAMGDLQAAISTSNIAAVWVAGGTYQPASGSSFTMREGVKIYGHFAGTENTLNDRDLSTSSNTSFLEGNGASVIRNDDNGLTPAAVLDGFTIKNGNATDPNNPDNSGNPSNFGGGIYNFNVSPTLTNLYITDNTAGYSGGGIWNDNNSSPTITNVIISGNTAGYGGGIINNASSPTLTNVIISGNIANNAGGGSGGGFYDAGSTSTLTNVLISGNAAINEGSTGGGAEIDANSNTTFTNVTIAGNTAGEGGGISIDNTSSLVLNNSIVLGNNSGIAGTIDASSSHNLIQTGDETSGGSADGTGVALDKTTPGEVFTSPQDPGSAPTSDGDYSLKDNSATVNAGDNSLYPGLNADTKDLAGNPRVSDFGVGGIIDLGAYEFLKVTPLKLISFNAEKGKTVVYLNWSTATEDNVNYFEVERSTDGSTFHAIGRVKATGNSNITQDYKFTDDAPADGNNFYRLKMVDLDGSASYSSVVNVRFRVSQVWTLSPNPATSYIMLQTSGAVNARTPVTITSAGGVMLGEYYMSTGSQTLKINISQLPAGTYYLRIISQDAGETVPFVKK